MLWNSVDNNDITRFQGNSIMELPTSVLKMKKLVSLYADENPLTAALPEKFRTTKIRKPSEQSEEVGTDTEMEIDISSLPIEERLKYIGKVIVLYNNKYLRY